MTDDREPFREARAAGKAKHHEQRLARYCQDVACPGKANCTDPDCSLARAYYTAAEVKVLTAKAREETAERIAQAIEGARIERHWNIVALAAAGECASIAREIGTKEPA